MPYVNPVDFSLAQRLTLWEILPDAITACWEIIPKSGF
jgi:hypothetical protein